MGYSMLPEPRALEDDRDLWTYAPGFGTAQFGAQPAGRQTRIYYGSATCIATNGLTVGTIHEVPTIPLLSDSKLLTRTSRAFLYEPGRGEMQLGLVSPSLEPERQASQALWVNSGGYVAGTTTIYSPEAKSYFSWLRTPAGQYLTDLDPTTPGQHEPWIVGEDNRVFGNTYNDPDRDYRPTDGWVYTPGSGTKVLPNTADGRSLVEPQPYRHLIVAKTDTEFTNGDGIYLTDGTSAPTRIDNVLAMNPQPGEVVDIQYVAINRRFVAAHTGIYHPRGDTSRYMGFAYSAETGTVSLGLFDAAHHGAEKYYHDIREVTDHAIVGVSRRGVSPYAPLDPWIWTPETGTRAINLLDLATLPPGTQYFGSPSHVNRQLQVVGYAVVRYFSGDVQTGTRVDGWFYDTATDSVTFLNYPGAADTDAEHIFDNGIVVGSYYGADNPYAGNVFLWSPDFGYVDIRSLSPELAGYASVDFSFAGDDLPIVYVRASGTGEAEIFAIFIPEPTLATAMILPALLLRRPTTRRR